LAAAEGRIIHMQGEFNELRTVAQTFVDKVLPEPFYLPVASLLAS